MGAYAIHRGRLFAAVTGVHGTICQPRFVSSPVISTAYVLRHVSNSTECIVALLSREDNIYLRTKLDGSFHTRDGSCQMAKFGHLHGHGIDCAPSHGRHRHNSLNFSLEPSDMYLLCLWFAHSEECLNLVFLASHRGPP